MSASPECEVCRDVSVLIAMRDTDLVSQSTQRDTKKKATVPKETIIQKIVSEKVFFGLQ